MNSESHGPSLTIVHDVWTKIEDIVARCGVLVLKSTTISDFGTINLYGAKDAAGLVNRHHLGRFDTGADVHAETVTCAASKAAGTDNYDGCLRVLLDDANYIFIHQTAEPAGTYSWTLGPM